MSAEIKNVAKLLKMELSIPGYQRPYRWTTKNVADLLDDIATAIEEAGKYHDYRYRIGSVILHRTEADGHLDIVDGQQRVLTLLLIMLHLDSDSSFPLLDNATFSNREAQENMRANYEFIGDWLGYQPDEWRERAMKAFANTLEAVVITVDRVEEAFQLFDSQNTRGRSLDPHDLLKAYHLRAMRDTPYEMRHVVTRWEEFSSDDVRNIFAHYLFPICNWEMKEKTHPFTAKDIDAYKGISGDRGYSYATRARRAAPCFQIGEPFIEGEDFFLMSEHYLQMRKDIELELKQNSNFDYIDEALNQKKQSAGYRYACKLFWCALFAYYDRFHNFDERAVRKLFTWAMMIRVDMQSLGFGTINKYAIGENPQNGRYTNTIPMFACIARARHHTDIANIRVEVGALPDRANPERTQLHKTLERCSKGGVR